MIYILQDHSNFGDRAVAKNVITMERDCVASMVVELAGHEVLCPDLWRGEPKADYKTQQDPVVFLCIGVLKHNHLTDAKQHDDNRYRQLGKEQDCSRIQNQTARAPNISPRDVLNINDYVAWIFNVAVVGIDLIHSTFATR